MLRQFNQRWIPTVEHFQAPLGIELKRQKIFCSFLFWLHFYLKQTVLLSELQVLLAIYLNVTPTGTF